MTTESEAEAVALFATWARLNTHVHDPDTLLRVWRAYHQLTTATAGWVPPAGPVEPGPAGDQWG